MLILNWLRMVSVINLIALTKTMNSYLRQNSEETILRSEGADEDFSDPLVDQIK